MGRYRVVKDVTGKSRPEHIVVWESVTGKKLPKGWVLHHIDGNGRNNDISNLMPMTIGEHVSLHNRLRGTKDDPVDATDPDVIENRKAMKQCRERTKDIIVLRKQVYYDENKSTIQAKHRVYQREYRKSHREKETAYARRIAPLLTARRKLKYAIDHNFPQLEISRRKAMVDNLTVSIGIKPYVKRK